MGDRIFNMEKGSQYIEHLENQTININIEKVESMNVGQAAQTTSTIKYKTDENIVNVINDLLSAKDEEGNNIMTDRKQWYAVYKVLGECCNYPTKMTDFRDKMYELGFDNASPSCDYNSFRVGANLDVARYKVTCWHQYKDVSDPIKKQVVVAEFLLKRLGLATEQ